MKKLFTSVFSILLFTTFSFGQDTSSVSHISDNLGNTESSRAIYKGTLLTSLSIDYNELKNQSEYSDHSFKTLGAPVMSVGYGLFKFMDIRAQVNLNYLESHYDDGSWYSYPSYNRFEIGTKINLFKQKGWIPELSYSLNGIREKYTFVTNTLAFSYNLGKNFRLGGNFELRLYDLESKINSREWYYSLNVRYELLPGFGAFADIEYQDDFYQSLNTQMGLYYRANNNIQFHLNGGKVFYETDRFNEYYVNGGFSWLLFRNQ